MQKRPYELVVDFRTFDVLLVPIREVQGVKDALECGGQTARKAWARYGLVRGTSGEQR